MSETRHSDSPQETMKSDWVPGEVPPADEVTEAFWEASRAHRLTVQQCHACQHVQHPPRALCTGCGSMEHLDQVDASGLGEVDSFTVVHRAPRQHLDTPYTIARVRLAEGPILLTRLVDRSGEEWTIGDRVEVRWTDLPDGRALPIFRPANQETS